LVKLVGASKTRFAEKVIKFRFDTFRNLISCKFVPTLTYPMMKQIFTTRT
jgi:hypothetical protein